MSNKFLGMFDVILKSMPKMTPEEAKAWREAHPEEAARVDAEIAKLRAEHPELFSADNK